MVQQEQSSQQPTENNSPLEQESTPTFEFNFQTGQLIKDGQVIKTITDQQQKLILLLVSLGEKETSLNELIGIISVIEKGKHLVYLIPEEQTKFRNVLLQKLEELLDTFAGMQDTSPVTKAKEVDNDVILKKETALRPHIELMYDPALNEFQVLGKPLDLPPLAQQILQSIVDNPGEWWSLAELEPLIYLGKKSLNYKRALVQKSVVQLNDKFIPGFYKYSKFPVEVKVEQQQFFVRLNTDIIDVSLKNADKTLLV